MSKKIGWVVVLCALAAVIWAYTSHFSPTYKFRYRVTVNVDTPVGIRSGSSVIQAEFHRSYLADLVFGPSFPSEAKGEAVFIDMGNDRNLILTLTNFQSTWPTSLPADYLPVKIYRLPWGDTDAFNSMERAISAAKLEAPKSVSIDALPLMILFDDRNNPDSLRRIDPADLDSEFGPGTKLRSVIIQATDDPIQTVLEEKLPWLKFLHDQALDGSRLTHTVNPLMIADFDLRRREGN